jgi:hypothetical protein
MLKRKKPTKALEKSARAVKDSDEFVEHIGNIADRYRREHALDAGRGSAVRKSMRELQKHSAALIAWLKLAHKTNQSTAEQEALNKIGLLVHGVAGQAHAESKTALTWLVQAEQAASRSLTDPKILPRKSHGTATTIAAEALRATFEYHKLKWATTLNKKQQSNAIHLLVAIANSAGDSDLSAEMAREAVRLVGSKGG